MWGKCTNCVIGDPDSLDGTWKSDVCPATYSVWLDLTGEPDGTVANIVETSTGEVSRHPAETREFSFISLVIGLLLYTTLSSQDWVPIVVGIAFVSLRSEQA